MIAELSSWGSPAPWGSDPISTSGSSFDKARYAACRSFGVLPRARYSGCGTSQDDGSPYAWKRYEDQRYSSGLLTIPAFTRVVLDIAQAREEIALVAHDRITIAAVPQRARSAVFLVVVLHVLPAEMLDRPR